MSGILMMVIAIVVLGGAYLLYGRYLQNKWGIDPNAKTPAYEMEDGVDYVPGGHKRSIWTSVRIYRRCRSNQWTDSGSNLWMASGIALDFNWWRILWRCSGFRIHVCICKK